MNRSMSRALFLAVALAACGGEAAREDAEPTTEQAAPPAPEAAPVTTATTADSAAAPEEPAAPTAGQSRQYEQCIARARTAGSEGEREVQTRRCASLPGAPRS